jgi:hypothetical protein
MGDLAICPFVIRRTDVPDELATNAPLCAQTFRTKVYARAAR